MYSQLPSVWLINFDFFTIFMLHHFLYHAIYIIDFIFTKSSVENIIVLPFTADFEYAWIIGMAVALWLT